MERAILCPQCNSPLTAHPFARSTICAFCGTTVFFDEEPISASGFHDAYLAWNLPDRYGIRNWCSIDDRHWSIEKLIGQGEISDVFTGRLARWPSELVVIKVLRDESNADRFENDWTIVNTLMKSKVNGAEFYSSLLPQPVLHGKIAAGSFTGKQTSIYRWQSGFKYTLADVMQVYPEGVEPRKIIWVWRRILEMLNFIHLSGYFHGSVTPENLLIQENDHGVRLVGYSQAGKISDTEKRPLGSIVARISGSERLSRQMDLIMSARCMVALLGGDVKTGQLSAAVPQQLARVVQRLVSADEISARGEDAWRIREELGRIADEVYGPPVFCPINLPKKLFGTN